MQSMKEAVEEVNNSLGQLKEKYPDFMSAFSQFLGATEKEGALDKKTKELIAISLSVANHCSWCIAFHVKGALAAGATRDEVMESCFVATLMGGGPSLMYTQLVMKALDEFEA